MHLTPTPAQGGAVVQGGGSPSPLDTFVPLSKYEGQAYSRPDHIACISAGYKTANGTPTPSRDGKIILHDLEGRAPGLKAILEANDSRFLTIAMPSNNPNDFIRQSFRKEGKSRLEAFGDDTGITEIKADGTRVLHAPGTPAFNKLKAESKVSTTISFFLAEYDESNRPVVIFPDGFGAYRLRTTSPNTVDSLLSSLRLISSYTGGQIAGFPLRVTLGNRNLCGPTGDKRNAPVFAFVLQPPRTIKLSSESFAMIASASAEVATLGMHALPPAETIDQAIEEFAQLELPFDEATFRAQWFALVDGTELDSKDARAAFLLDFTGGKTDSLKAFLETATAEDARALINAAEYSLQGARLDTSTGEVTLEAADAIDAEFEEVPPAAEAPDPAEPLDDAQFEAIAQEIKRVGWDASKGRAYLKKAFRKESRSQLTRGEADAFLAYLKTQPTATAQEETGDA